MTQSIHCWPVEKYGSANNKPSPIPLNPQICYLSDCMLSSVDLYICIYLYMYIDNLAVSNIGKPYKTVNSDIR